MSQSRDYSEIQIYGLCFWSVYSSLMSQAKLRLYLKPHPCSTFSFFSLASPPSQVCLKNTQSVTCLRIPASGSASANLTFTRRHPHSHSHVHAQTQYMNMDTYVCTYYFSDSKIEATKGEKKDQVHVMHLCQNYDKKPFILSAVNLAFIPNCWLDWLVH